MKMFVSNIVLAVIWALMNERFRLVDLGVGFVFGYVLLLFLQPLIGQSVYFSKLLQIARFLLFFLKELIVANLRVAYHVITPKSSFKPGILAVDLEWANDLERTLVANVITLTPGSFSVDISPDRRYLYVHVMDVDQADKVRVELKEQYEKSLLEVLR